MRIIWFWVAVLAFMLVSRAAGVWTVDDVAMLAVLGMVMLVDYWEKRDEEGLL